MNTVKRFIKGAALSCALALSSLCAHAQLGVPAQIINSGTNVIPGATQWTNAIGAGGITLSNSPVIAMIDCTGSKELAMEWNSSLMGAGTVASQIYFYRGLSGKSSGPWETTAPYFIWGITPNGTTAVDAVTNLTVAGVPYLYCTIITNGAASASSLTNFTLRIYSVKR